MTPLEALHEASRVAETAEYHRLDEPIREVHVLVCTDCTQAVLAELRRVFPPLVHDETRMLAGSHLLGCTFEDGAVEMCALHPFLAGNALCP